MKKILFAIALSLLAVACEKEEDALSVQFDKKNYVMSAEEAVNIKIVASQVPATDLEIPVQIGGNAVLDEDYTISSRTVVIRQGTASAELTLTPKYNTKENLKVTLSLEAGTGYVLGNVPVAEVAVSPKEVMLWSFKQAAGEITNELEIELTLAGKKSGVDFVASSDIKLPFTISATSTAKLGEDFTIKDDAKEFVIKKGEKSGKITVVANETAEKPVIAPSAIFTITPAEEYRFEAGVNAEFVLYFQGTFSFTDLIGKWQYDSYPLLEDPNCDYWLLEMMIMDSGDKAEDFPSHNTKEDVLEFKVLDGADMLCPALTGDLKKFFREAEITSIMPIEYNFYYYGTDPKWTCYELTLSKANKLFSGTAEQLGEAKIIISLREEGKLLDVVVRDYVPTDFLNNMYTYDNGSIHEYQPELWDQYFVFKKVE